MSLTPMAVDALKRLPPELWLCISKNIECPLELQLAILMFTNSQYRFVNLPMDTTSWHWRAYLMGLFKQDWNSLPCYGCGLLHPTCSKVEFYHSPLCDKAKEMWKPFSTPQAGLELAVPKIKRFQLWVLEMTYRRARNTDLWPVADGVRKQLAKINERLAKQIADTISSDGRPITMEVQLPANQVLIEVSTSRTLAFGDIPHNMDTGRDYLWRCCPKASEPENLFHGCFEFCKERGASGKWCQKCRLRDQAADIVRLLEKHPEKRLALITLWSGKIKPKTFRRESWNCAWCQAEHFAEYSMSDEQRLAGHLTLRTGMRRTASGEAVRPGYSWRHAVVDD